eukprot:350576-Chlamydomonas_euryale.AAC.8
MTGSPGLMGWWGCSQWVGCRAEQLCAGGSHAARSPEAVQRGSSGLREWMAIRLSSAAGSRSRLVSKCSGMSGRQEARQSPLGSGRHPCV